MHASLHSTYLLHEHHISKAFHFKLDCVYFSHLLRLAWKVYGIVVLGQTKDESLITAFCVTLFSQLTLTKTAICVYASNRTKTYNQELMSPAKWDERMSNYNSKGVYWLLMAQPWPYLGIPCGHLQIQILLIIFNADPCSPPAVLTQSPACLHIYISFINLRLYGHAWMGRRVGRVRDQYMS